MLMRSGRGRSRKTSSSRFNTGWEFLIN
jgi:hypothetical protein